LPVKESRQAIEVIKPGFIDETVKGETYWFHPDTPVPNAVNEKTFILPAYDELIISYKNREATLTYEKHLKVVSNNGFFRPAIVYDSQVIGIWKRTIKASKLNLETEYFCSPGKTIQKQVEKEFEKYARFLGKKLI
jgi:hypothetical protein